MRVSINAWNVKPLGEFTSISKGNKHDIILTSPTNGGSRYIQIEDLRTDNNLKYTDEKGVEVTNKDIIIDWDGANAGTIGFGLQGFIGSTLARLRIVSEGISPIYLGWFLRSQFSSLREHCTGATIPHINKTYLESIRVPLPPLPIQKQIASILEKADVAREKRRQANQLTEQFLQSAFLEMFGDRCRERLEWNWKPGNDKAIYSRSSSGRNRSIVFFLL
ncbi:MAG: restriction endonuclease subunit S [bacterium]